ncbi:MAG: ERF family protein [Dehalococcoidia bacterium]|jgi:hypothetical protein
MSEPTEVKIKPLNLMQRLNEIRKKVQYIRKTQKVETYVAVTHDAVTAETRDWFVEFGVMILPYEVSSQMLDTGSKSQKGNPLYRFEGTYQIGFVNCDNPSDRESVVVSAHANDYGDKAPGKALSYAVKAAILKVLMIETGESDEARVTINLSPEDEVGPDQLTMFLAGIKAADNEESLRETYLAASAASSKDKQAMAALVAAKNVRYREMFPKKDGQ